MREEKLSERPLVTFAIFAYNQENYIREAIEGAFSQTYEPLEIILSDDCSSDKTFQIMKEMAAQYQGPHKIRARSSQINVGTLNHIFEVVNEAAGEFLVVAAGDDISLKNRVETLVPYFEGSDIVAISSDDIVINQVGEPVDIYTERFKLRDIQHAKNPSWFHGGTAAYRLAILKTLPTPTTRILYEDAALIEFFRICRLNSFRIKDQLIYYRIHGDNISGKTNEDTSLWDQEQRSMLRWARVSKAKGYAYHAALVSGRGDNYCLNLCRKNSDYYSMLSEWTKLDFLTKIKLFLLSMDLGNMRSCIPRLFGIRVYKFIFSLKGRCKNASLY